MTNKEKTPYWQCVEPIWDKVGIYGNSEVFITGFAQLPAAVGDFYAAHWLVSEV